MPGCLADIPDALTACIEQASIAFTLMDAQHRSDLPGHSERDQEVMYGHQFDRLLFDPDLRLLMATTGAVSVAARAAYPVLTLASATLVVDSTERPGATSHD
jgi:hypothetical protein